MNTQSHQICCLHGGVEVSYARFAPCYVPMVRERKHFEKQVAVVKCLLGELGNSRAKPPKVLDAACGTGDVLGMLAEDGNLSLAGADGSHEMISCALGNKSCE